MDRAVNPITCPDGMKHRLTYLGRAKQGYQCERCGCFVSKSELRRADEIEEVQHGTVSG